MKEQKKAWVNWSAKDRKWVLRLWIDDEWKFSKSWGVKYSYVADKMGWSRQLR